MPTITVTRDASLEVLPSPLDQLEAAWLLGFASTNTRAAYRRDLARWRAWCDEVGVEVPKARRVHVDAWVRSMDDAAPSTLARRLAAVASFYGYALDEGVVERNPAARVRRPKVDQHPPEGLSRDEARALLAASRSDARDEVVVGLLLLLGLRASEVAALDVDDLTVDRGHRVVVVRGKGSTVARLPLPPSLSDAVDRHRDGRTTGPLVVGIDGARLDRHRVARIVARCAKTAGIARPVRPHALRHAAVTHALAAGAPLHRVQDLARHADPRTTRRYDRAAGALEGHASYLVAGFLEQ